MELSSNVMVAGIFLVNAVVCFVLSKVMAEKNAQFAKIMNMGIAASLLMAPVMYFIIKR